jgi:hypothetical protein
MLHPATGRWFPVSSSVFDEGETESEVSDLYTYRRRHSVSPIRIRDQTSEDDADAETESDSDLYRDRRRLSGSPLRSRDHKSEDEGEVGLSPCVVFQPEQVDDMSVQPTRTYMYPGRIDSILDTNVLDGVISTYAKFYADSAHEESAAASKYAQLAVQKAIEASAHVTSIYEHIYWGEPIMLPESAQASEDDDGERILLDRYRLCPDAVPARWTILQTLDPLQSLVESADFLQAQSNENSRILKMIAHHPEDILTLRTFCRIAALGTPQQRYHELYDAARTRDFRLLPYLLSKCETEELSNGFEEILAMVEPATTRVLCPMELEMLHAPNMTDYSIGKRLNAIACSLVGTNGIPITPLIRGFMRGHLQTPSSARLLLAGSLGAFAFLTVLELYRLSSTCASLSEEFKTYPDAVSRSLSVPIGLSKGSADQISSANGRILISGHNVDLFDRIPVLLSACPKIVDITRINMRQQKNLPFLSKLFCGENHTLILRGFPSDKALDFLKSITNQGALGHSISRLELQIKAHTHASYEQHMAKMGQLCSFVTAWFPFLKHFSLIKSPSVSRNGCNNDRPLTPPARYISAALDAVEAVSEGLPADLMCHSLRSFYLDFPEVDTDPFLSFITKFDHLEHLTLQRMSPVFARRSQLVTQILAANRNTLRSVDIDFRSSHYGIDPSISGGVQELLLSPLVVYSTGLKIRIPNRHFCEKIKVNLVDGNGRITGLIVTDGAAFLVCP